MKKLSVKEIRKAIDALEPGERQELLRSAVKNVKGKRLTRAGENGYNAPMPSATLSSKSAGKIGRKIAEIREAACLTQEQLAARSGVSRPHLAHIESGHHRPQTRTLSAIADGLGLTTDDLLAGV